MTDFIVTQTSEEYHKFKKAKAQKDATLTFWILTIGVLSFGLICYLLGQPL